MEAASIETIQPLALPPGGVLLTVKPGVKPGPVGQLWAELQLLDTAGQVAKVAEMHAVNHPLKRLAICYCTPAAKDEVLRQIHAALNQWPKLPPEHREPAREWVWFDVSDMSKGGYEWPAPQLYRSVDEYDRN